MSKKSELYLTGVVIPNGIPDFDDDILNAKDIKIIFAKYMNRLTDINHNDVSYYGIEVLANWISESDTSIAGRTVPAKSWLATVKVLNPEIIELVNKGELRGFSLSSTYVGDVKSKDGERVKYSDLQSSEEVIPIRISLVKKPANGFAFEEADYETFINKMEVNNMGDESKFTLGDLKNIFKFKSDLEENLIEKAAPEEEGNAAGVGEADKSVEALFEKVDMLLEKVSAIESALKGEEEPDDDKIEKAEDESDKKDEDESEKEAGDKKIEEEEDESDKKDEDESEKEDDDKKIEKAEGEEADDKEIKKSAEEIDTKKIHKGVTSKAHDVPEVPEKVNTFYNRTNRDHLGRKIRK